MLTRNETILPSTFQYYGKGAFGKTTGYGNHATLEILGGQGDQNGALVIMPPTDNSENSIYFTTSKLTTGYTTGTTGTWALGNNIGFTDHLFYGTQIIQRILE